MELCDGAKNIENSFKDANELENESGDEVPKKRYVQVYNPLTGRWVKIDRETGRVVAHKKSPKPYKNVPKYKKKTE